MTDDNGAAARDWLTTLPQALQDGLAQIARATAGMSEDEKKGTAGWLLKLSQDEGAPPAIREFTRASFQFLVGVMATAEESEREGHIDRAARAEELLRQLRRSNPEEVMRRIHAKDPDSNP